MLRVGLVGIGDAGRHHARALASLHREGALAWSAVCARGPERLAALAKEVALPEGVLVAPSLDALLASRACDAVILATPDGLHAGQVERAAAAGLGVLVEKPLALSREEGARAVEAARRAGVHLQVGYHLRHHAAHRLVVERAPALVGAVRGIFVRWAWPDPATDGWRARGEAGRFWSLAALGTHGIDLAMMLAGTTDVTDVAAVREPPSGVDRAAEVSLRLRAADGRAILAHVSVAVTHRAVSRVLVTGDAGEIEAVGTLGARGDGELSWRAPRQAPAALAVAPAGPYEAQLRDFAGRAAAGFTSDAATLMNLDVLDRLDGAPAAPNAHVPGGSS
jgi:predicted dehydrogenase